MQTKRISVKNNKIRLILKSDPTHKPEGLILTYRGNGENVVYPLEFATRKRNTHWETGVEIDPQMYALEDGYWDIWGKVEGEQDNQRVHLSKRLLLRLMLGNVMCRLDNRGVLFPCRSHGSNLAFSCRAGSEYDSISTRIREFAAVFVYFLLKPYWKRKRIWLVFEKFCEMAQDNGYYFFRYCMEELPKEERRRIFYIIDTEAADYHQVRKYGGQVIPFMSFRHMLYSAAAELYIGSDSKAHLYKWRAKPNLISLFIGRRKLFFLQHGVTGLKRVDPIFGKNGSNPTDYFAVVSEFEQKIIVDNFGYEKEKVPVLGFTRWDVLRNDFKKGESFILVMPTWRSWLEDKDPGEFKTSDYYKKYAELLQDERLRRLLKEQKVKMVFYIHPKFKSYLKEFQLDEEEIELVDAGARPLNCLLRECAMLVTDYSSVCWDVYYLEKPVMFYHFDLPLYEELQGSYMNLREELFGRRYTTGAGVIDGIADYMKTGFAEEAVYGDMRQKYFAFRDQNNCRRTYEFISGKIH